MIIPQEPQFKPTKEHEIFYQDEDIVVYYYPGNNSLHALDVDSMRKIIPSRICNSRDHAKQVLNSIL